jgi:3D (Asp-Asp-Asp) domain-containing protein
MIPGGRLDRRRNGSAFLPENVRRLSRWLLISCGLALLVAALGSCQGNGPSRSAPSVVRTMTVTAYCDCKSCCGWKRTWYGKPVYAYGASKGERKKVGVTASGTKAKIGTLAADTSLYPFGTLMFVPGYGYGRVEDRGSAIKGDHIDLFFKSHKEALQWGRQQRQVHVWFE